MKKRDTPPPTTIDEYIAEFPWEIQEKLQEVRACILSIATDATETISYGIPTFKMLGKNLIHFAAYKNHIGLYPGPGPISHFKEQLAVYETSKGTVKFPLEKEMPFKVIKEIVAYALQFRKSK